MKVEAQDAAGPPPSPMAGRPRVYPYATMSVGQFFFVPHKPTNTVGPHAYRQGKRLGRKFSTRLQWMKRAGDGWVDATVGEPGAVIGVGVYRTE